MTDSHTQTQPLVEGDENDMPAVIARHYRKFALKEQEPGAEQEQTIQDPKLYRTVTEIEDSRRAANRLPTDRTARKHIPIATGCIDYFPDALAAVAECSRIATDQHHPGDPLHWDRSKSTDEADALMRHFIERGTIDTDGVRHSAKVAWRALALLQKEIEASR